MIKTCKQNNILSCSMLLRIVKNFLSFICCLKVKTLSVLCLVILSCIDLVFWSFKLDSRPVDLVDPIIRLLTFFSVLVVIQAERRKGKRISPIQFVRSLKKYNLMIPFKYVFKVTQSYSILKCVTISTKFCLI